jgi:hypothetical protein
MTDVEEAFDMSEDKILRLDSPALKELYNCVDELLRHELRAALGTKCEITKVRKELLSIIQLAKLARKEIFPITVTPAGVRARLRYMEKYGVAESKEKTASENSNDQHCPKCGGKVESHGAVHLCQQCGSAPFEPGTEERVGEDRGSDSNENKT